MNFCFYIGRITKDPELRKTQNGKSVCSFSLAVNRIPEGVDFIDCVAWERTAEILTQYTHKGNKLAVSGEMRNRSYEDRDGRKVTRCECIVRTLELLEPKTDAPKVEEPNFEPYSEDGDLPF